MAYNNNNRNSNARGNGNYQPKPKREEEKFDRVHEQQIVYAWLSDPHNKAIFKQALGPKVDLDRWAASVREAVEAKPELLAPSLRESLFFSVKKAAQQTLKPDGRQGALIPRWNREAGQKLVCWQPMVQGVMLLGRRAGVLKSLTAEIVFVGEPFKFLRGDDPKIIHEWVPEIREKAYALLRNPSKQTDPNAPPDFDGADQGGPLLDAFWDEIVAAYCIIEGPDGLKTRRALTRSRILLLRDFAKARGGPWFSVWLDEMVIKSIIHHTAKHIDTSVDDEHAFMAWRTALEQDLDVDLDNEDDDDAIVDVSPAPASSQAALPPPDVSTNKLYRFDPTGQGPARETVPAGGETTEAPKTEQKAKEQQPPAPPPPAPPPADGEPGQQQASNDQADNDPILINDDGADIEDPEKLQRIAEWKRWCRKIVDIDLTGCRSVNEVDRMFGLNGYEGNPAIVRKLRNMVDKMPNTLDGVMKAVDAYRAKLEAQQKGKAA